ncbi:MAG: YdcF family protein, partial [Methylococcaceae bacterium]
MLHLLEAKTAPLNNPPPAADAIVILGSGTYFHAPEYADQDTVNARALQRLRYGAKLFRETHQPILVTGGKPLGNAISEAQQMRTVLEQDFQVPVRWTEDMSNNTFENARYSLQILQKADIKKIYLVTHAWHMPRSTEVFRRAGFDVIEAPTVFATRFKTDLFTFIPDTGALVDSTFFVHEIIGLIWYQIKS